MMTKEFAEKLRFAGCHGDALHCWNMCIKAADTIETQSKLLDQALNAMNLVILYDYLGRPCGIANEWEKSIPLAAAVEAIKKFEEHK